jgi:tetratricopeptide (TPR) repeat protein
MAFLQRGILPTPGSVRDLLDRAFEVRFNDRSLAQEASSTAVLLAESGPIPIDLKGAAWTQYANALRVAGRFTDAEVALRVAAEHLGESASAANRAVFLEISASLARDLNNFCGALPLLDGALAIYLQIDDVAAITRVLVLRGLALKDCGRGGEAVAVLKAALDALDPREDYSLYFAAGHGMVDALISCKRLGLAESCFNGYAEVFLETTVPLLQAKVVWLKGRLLAARGASREAQEKFERALEVMEREGAPVPDLTVLRADLQALAPL